MHSLSLKWISETAKDKYTYHVSWMGIPIIQFPQDMIAMQELIWRIKPDLIVETGIAHGGSIIYYASLLELVGANGLVIGIDRDIRSRNRAAIESHPMFKRIKMFEGSSTDTNLSQSVIDAAKDRQRIIVVLDSNHTHDHVLRELEIYSKLVKKDSYLVVFDTVIEDMPEGSFPDRPWDTKNNPKTAVREFLQTNKRFVIDDEIEKKLLITVAPSGYLKCISD